jgi:hypothetical protein
MAPWRSRRSPTGPTTTTSTTTTFPSGLTTAFPSSTRSASEWPAGCHRRRSRRSVERLSESSEANRSTSTQHHQSALNLPTMKFHGTTISRTICQILTSLPDPHRASSDLHRCIQCRRRRLRLPAPMLDSSSSLDRGRRSTRAGRTSPSLFSISIRAGLDSEDLCTLLVVARCSTMTLASACP